MAEKDFEDFTAFGDEFQYKKEDRKEKEINFALDDQYLLAKWRIENSSKIIKFLVTVSLPLFLSIAFSFLGGYMFSSIEEYNEIESCKGNRAKYYEIRQNALEALIQSGSNFQLSPSERLEEYETTLQKFVEAYSSSGWQGEDCEGKVPLWDFIGSTFFSVTAITSIGYGHIAPLTFWGRLIFIIYAIIGVPMFLAALAQIGGFCSEITHFVYHNMCCCGTCKDNKGNAEAKKMIKEKMFEEWRKGGNAPNAHFLEILEDSSGGDSSEEDAADELTEAKLVPVSVSLLILFSVILLGGSIFTITENWSWVDSIYFSFVTVSTLGFGDLVPGLINNRTEYRGGRIFSITWFYITFGMVILSMSLQMIQESIEDKVRHLLSYFSDKKTQDSEKNNPSGFMTDFSSNPCTDNESEIDEDLPGPGNWDIPISSMPVWMAQDPYSYDIMESGYQPFDILPAPPPDDWDMFKPMSGTSRPRSGQEYPNDSSNASPVNNEVESFDDESENENGDYGEIVEPESSNLPDFDSSALELINLDAKVSANDNIEATGPNSQEHLTPDIPSEPVMTLDDVSDNENDKAPLSDVDQQNEIKVDDVIDNEIAKATLPDVDQQNEIKVDDVIDNEIAKATLPDVDQQNEIKVDDVIDNEIGKAPLSDVDQQNEIKVDDVIDNEIAKTTLPESDNQQITTSIPIDMFPFDDD